MTDDQLDLIPKERKWWQVDEPTTKGMVRRTDPATSLQAAVSVALKLNALQMEVLAAYREHGPMSARQAEVRFPDYGFSTIRKRVSELHKLGFLRDVGTETESGKTSATVYEVVQA